MPSNSPVLDGRFVHNAGNLHMNITNWGFLGSLPKSRYPMADVPSAQYPAGSGIEYLYAAGIWVGAEKNGIPSVSTGYPETEFYPAMGGSGTIFTSFEGDPRGGRLPGPADDDGDGRIDEDPPDGVDNDGDGKIDEDFAAIGKQMFNCWFSDDQQQSRVVWPQHEPLGIRVRQETFQWGEAEFEDFIGVRYWIDNVGTNFLTNLYVGIYADLDAGPREYGSYHMDDQVGFYSGWWCAKKDQAEIPMQIRVAYVYDDDGDEGRTPAYFGIALMGHSTDPNGFDGLPWFPWTLMSSFRIFQGLAPFINGGDPTNDYERYEVLASRMRQPDTEKPGDYRILLSCGPFWYLEPEKSFHVDFAFVAGDDLEDLLYNTAAAQQVYEGTWYDLDGDPETGVIGRESPVIGPLEDYDPDICDGIIERYDVIKLDTIWSNLDCFIENHRLKGPSSCYRKIDADISTYWTGKNGKEHNLPWITGSAPATPNMRLVPGNGAVEIYWDDLSETVPDPFTLQMDFEGYQVWRADGWHRPPGTTERTGPAYELWSLLDARDIPNGISPDLDFRAPEAAGGWVYEPLRRLEDREAYETLFELQLLQYPADTALCPPELDRAVCDTLEGIVRRRLGLPGGKRYYRFVDREAKNGLPYFYSVAPYDHVIRSGRPAEQGRFNSPSANFEFVRARSDAQPAAGFDVEEVYVVPNPVTDENMSPWRLAPNNSDASGLRCEFRNLPACLVTLRIYTVAGDLVEVMRHDGSGGDGTAAWNLISRNGQDVTSGVYIFSVEPEDGSFPRTIGKFVVIR